MILPVYPVPGDFYARCKGRRLLALTAGIFTWNNAVQILVCPYNADLDEYRLMRCSLSRAEAGTPSVTALNIQKIEWKFIYFRRLCPTGSIAVDVLTPTNDRIWVISCRT